MAATVIAKPTTSQMRTAFCGSIQEVYAVFWQMVMCQSAVINPL